jgi:hypothetical protein
LRVKLVQRRNLERGKTEMKSVIVQGPKAAATALKWTKNPKTPILTVVDLGPAHVNDVRVVFANDFDADFALTQSGNGWFVLHDSYLKYGFAGTVIYVHPDAP